MSNNLLASLCTKRLVLDLEFSKPQCSRVVLSLSNQALKACQTKLLALVLDHIESCVACKHSVEHVGQQSQLIEPCT